MVVINLQNFDQDKFYLLKGRISQTKAEHLDLIKESDDMMCGSRYDNDARIAQMVLGYLYQEVDFNYEDANKLFLSLSSIETDPYIKKAVLESASADYYYAFEKRWD